MGEEKRCKNSLLAIPACQILDITKFYLFPYVIVQTIRKSMAITSEAPHALW